MAKIGETWKIGITMPQRYTSLVQVGVDNTVTALITGINFGNVYCVVDGVSIKLARRDCFFMEKLIDAPTPE